MVLFICKNFTFAHKRKLLSFLGSASECAAVRAISCKQLENRTPMYVYDEYDQRIIEDRVKQFRIRPAATWPVN